MPVILQDNKYSIHLAYTKAKSGYKKSTCFLIKSSSDFKMFWHLALDAIFNLTFSINNLIV